MRKADANDTEFKSFKEIWKIITSIEGQKFSKINFKKRQESIFQIQNQLSKNLILMEKILTYS